MSFHLFDSTVHKKQCCDFITQYFRMAYSKSPIIFGFIRMVAWISHHNSADTKHVMYLAHCHCPQDIILLLFAVIYTHNTKKKLLRTSKVIGSRTMEKAIEKRYSNGWQMNKIYKRQPNMSHLTASGFILFK